MSSSGLIYAVIVGAWAAYLVPMWLRRQDELNEARPTERFSTAIRLLSGRAGMERRYAKDLRARSADEGEPDIDAPDAVTDSVDVRAFAVPPTRPQVSGAMEAAPGTGQAAEARTAGTVPAPARPDASASPRKPIPPARRAPGAEAAAARAQRSKVLARRRRTTIMLFLAFTLGAIVAAVGGLAFLWAPGVPAVLLSGYIAYLRTQERRRFAYQMDRRRAEAAAQRLRERARQPRRHPTAEAEADEPEEGPEPEAAPGMSALAADRRALVEQTDHAEWVDQQRERQRRPGRGESWEPVPVPLPTYVTAPVAPRATPDVDLGALDAWSSARSSPVARDQEAVAGSRKHGSGVPAPASPSDAHAEEPGEARETDGAAGKADGEGRGDARRRAASARRARERGRTPLFDQYEDGERPRAANE
ncbi:gephyrin-like molybdotransferase receptor GlpR [Streptomyces sp. Z423-1]|uniref:divisome protein SepX/GlpR n=1 Tax=unclassified Streptomyces TaxID=2593676 RepID=UPI0014893D8A|nr:gephyrin-like molybdotransferase receptor GlpR [Streptomyces sp. Z423-1]